MAPNQIVIFVEVFHRRATMMGWNQGAMQITLFANSAGCQVDIIKSYGKIDKATLKSACERFYKPGEVHFQTRAKQNNTMMSICLAKSLMADAQARLLTYRNEYTFDGVECAPSHVQSHHDIGNHQLCCHHPNVARQPAVIGNVCGNG
jgi:hypothetical protein